MTTRLTDIRAWVSRLLIAVATLTAPAVTNAQSAVADSALSPAMSDTLQLRFRLGVSELDLQFADNEASWHRFERMFRSRYAGKAAADIHVDIYAGASPEGPAELNRRLGENRGYAVRQLLRERLGASIGSISIINLGARWGDFYRAVAESHKPWKFDVMKIVDSQAGDSDWDLDPRERRLRRLEGGRVWPQLQPFLEPLRSGSTAIVTYIPDRADYCDTLVIRDTVYYMPLPLPHVEHPLDTSAVWALKSNLLMLGILAPNIQAEHSLGSSNRWSLQVGLICPWWTFAHNAYALEILDGSLELRRWLGNRGRHHTLDGWYTGLGASIGKHDLEWRSKGHQGEHYRGFLSLGYQHRWGRRKQWAIDTAIGFGVLYATQRYYHGSSIYPVGRTERYDDHLMFREHRRFFWPGCTHANISIAYLLGRKQMW